MIYNVPLDDTFRRAEGWVVADRILPDEIAREDRGSAGRGVIFGLMFTSLWWFGFACGYLLHAILT